MERKLTAATPDACGSAKRSRGLAILPCDTNATRDRIAVPQTLAFDDACYLRRPGPHDPRLHVGDHHMPKPNDAALAAFISAKRGAMNIPNRITLSDLCGMQVGAIAALSGDELAPLRLEAEGPLRLDRWDDRAEMRRPGARSAQCRWQRHRRAPRSPHAPRPHPRDERPLVSPHSKPGAQVHLTAAWLNQGRMVRDQRAATAGYAGAHVEGFSAAIDTNHELASPCKGAGIG